MTTVGFELDNNTFNVDVDIDNHVVVSDTPIQGLWIVRGNYFVVINDGVYSQNGQSASDYIQRLGDNEKTFFEVKHEDKNNKNTESEVSENDKNVKSKKLKSDKSVEIKLINVDRFIKKHKEFTYYDIIEIIQRLCKEETIRLKNLYLEEFKKKELTPEKIRKINEIIG